MTLLLAICLLLVMGCLLMTLSALTQLEKLKTQNKLMAREFKLFRDEYQKLTQGIRPAPASKKAPLSESPGELTPEEQLKANAYQLQTVIERFSFAHKGHYPMSVADLQNFLNQENHTESVFHPYLEKEVPLLGEENCLDITLDPVDEGLEENKGKLLYQANADENNEITDYAIAAFDGQGILLRAKDKQVFTLSKTAS